MDKEGKLAEFMGWRRAPLVDLMEHGYGWVDRQGNRYRVLPERFFNAFAREKKKTCTAYGVESHDEHQLYPGDTLLGFSIWTKDDDFTPHL